MSKLKINHKKYLFLPHQRLQFLAIMSHHFIRAATHWLLVHTCTLSCFSHVWLFVTLWTVAHQAPLYMGFSRQEYWGGLPCPPPGDLPNPGIKPMSPISSALAGSFFTTSAMAHSRCSTNSWMSEWKQCCGGNRTSRDKMIELYCERKLHAKG